MTKNIKCRISALIALVLSTLLFTTVPVSAQTVAEAARRERERKKAAAHKLHVYTNEDLAKPQILLPEDQARVIAPNLPLQASTASSPNARKQTAAATIAATPNIEIIDSFSGPIPTPGTIAVVTATPGPVVFSPTASEATPLFTPKGDIAIPAVNLPLATANADPFPGATLIVNFPESGSVSTAAPRNFRPASPLIVAPAINDSMGSSEPAMVGAATGASAAAFVHGVVVPEATKPSLAERPAVNVEPPSIAAPAESFPMFRAEAPFDAPIAPTAPTPAEKPAELAGRIAGNSGGATVTVEHGDSLWKLAERYLGNGKLWSQLAKLNPQLSHPALIHPGDPIHLPLLPQARTDQRKIVVRRGDTLWSIAQSEFEQPEAVTCIAEANQLQSSDVIRVGQRLVLPDSCSVSQ